MTLHTMEKFAALVAITLMCLSVPEISCKPIDDLDNLSILLKLEKRLLELKRDDVEVNPPEEIPGQDDATGEDGEIPPLPNAGEEESSQQLDGEDGGDENGDGDGDTPPGDGNDDEEANGIVNGDGHTLLDDEEMAIEGESSEQGSQEKPQDEHGGSEGAEIETVDDDVSSAVSAHENDDLFSLKKALEEFNKQSNEKLKKIIEKVKELDFAKAADYINNENTYIGEAISLLDKELEKLKDDLKFFETLKEDILKTKNEVLDATEQKLIAEDESKGEQGGGFEEGEKEEGNEEGEEEGNEEGEVEGNEEGEEEGNEEGEEEEEGNEEGEEEGNEEGEEEGNENEEEEEEVDEEGEEEEIGEEEEEEVHEEGEEEEEEGVDEEEEEEGVDEGDIGEINPPPPPPGSEGNVGSGNNPPPEEPSQQQPEGQPADYKRRQALLGVLRALEREEVNRIISK